MPDRGLFDGFDELITALQEFVKKIDLLLEKLDKVIEEMKGE